MHMKSDEQTVCLSGPFLFSRTMKDCVSSSIRMAFRRRCRGIHTAVSHRRRDECCASSARTSQRAWAKPTLQSGARVYHYRPQLTVNTTFTTAWRDYSFSSLCSPSEMMASSHDETTAWAQSVMTPATRALAEQLTTRDKVSGNDDSSQLARRWALARAITMMESTSPSIQEQASALLTCLLHHQNHHTAQKNQEESSTTMMMPSSSFRIGFAGSPGSGKSSLIEAFGMFLLHNASRRTSGTTDGSSQDNATLPSPPPPPSPISQLAVVCVDPSSLRTGGSILGDKTRMTALSTERRAYIRPAPAQGVLGGLAPRTDDVLRLLSLYYEMVWLETVGLGQSETEAIHAVDMLILVVPPGGGDDLQGFKKGIVEVADLIVVTKADGHLLSMAQHTAGDYRGAMQFLHRVTAPPEPDADDNDQAGCTNSTNESSQRTNTATCHGGSYTPVVLTSCVTGHGLDGLWQAICTFRNNQVQSGRLESRRRRQRRYWMWKNFQQAIQEQATRDPALAQAADSVLHDLDAHLIPPRLAVTRLLQQLPHSR
jgi:LAO/AO transport system kinase